MKSVPWAVIGDFNEIMYSRQMIGGRKRNHYQIRNFRMVLKDCNLTDLGFSGYLYTFSNRRKGADETRARLDRVTANKEWMELFPNAAMMNVFVNTSDYLPLVLYLDKNSL